MARKQDSDRGPFITFEGIEGSGKSSQAARLAKRLREAGYRVVETREPGGTPLAERIRDLLLAPSLEGGPSEAIAPRCEALLILAARGQHLAEVIEPALREGTVVLCDRFFDSTLAYQGFGRGLDLEGLRRGNRLATGGLAPDLTLLFDCPVRIGLDRRRRQARRLDRLDRESDRFHEKVRRGFLALAKREPRRVHVLDGTRQPDAVAAEVEALVFAWLTRHRSRDRRAPKR